jgi:hypothetical protein
MTIQQERFKDRELYDAPEVEVLEVKSEGIICGSGETEQYGPGNNYSI